MIKVIHIGLHKTGSTFLQKWFWPTLENLFGHGYEWERPHVDRFFHSSYLDRAPSVVSQECLSGILGPARPGQSWERFRRFSETAARINPPPKVIMIVREHRSWLRSAYLDKLKRGYRESFREYLNRFDAKDLSWDARCEVLEANFPECFVGSFGRFRHHPRSFLSRLCEFLQVDTDPIMSSFDRAAKRVVNSSPRTEFALRAARVLYSAPGFTLTYLSAMPLLIKSHKEHHSACSWIRDQCINLANRIPYSKSISFDDGLPDETAAILDRDWEAVSERFRHE